MLPRIVLGLFLLCLAVPAGAQRPALRAASRPNLDLSVYRRSFTPGEDIRVRLSAYNEHTITFHLWRLDLPSLVPTSRALENFGKKIAAVETARLPIVRTWSYPLGKTYRDQWAEREITVARLTPGIYLIGAGGEGAEKRTWFAVTAIALLAKQSRQALLVYAAGANSGQPVPGLHLTATDTQGRRLQGVTDASGVWQTDRQGLAGNLWVFGTAGPGPAFVLSGPPAAPDPYTVYAVTDRPIYRPGHRILFKGTIRQRLEGAAPGGVLYHPYASQPATVEIRDATDALVSRRQVKTGAFGSFDGAFQLASEPTLGRWQLIVVLGAFRAYAPFQVEAYRKPEFTVGVTVPQAHFLGGSVVPVTIAAHYYFGQPVTNAAVDYTIGFSSQDGGDRIEPDYQGHGVTDARGELILNIKTQRLPGDRTVSVNAAVTDLSRRSQGGSGGALITGGLFRLTVEPDRALYRPGEHVMAVVHAEDYDGKPVSVRARVRLIETKYDRRHRPYQEITSRDVVTNAAGRASAVFTPPRPGDLQLEAVAFDSDDNKILASGEVWVAGDRDADYPTLSLLADRASYHPGEIATVLLNTSLVTPTADQAARRAARQPAYGRAWALVTVEGERLYSHQVVPLSGRSSVLRVPVSDLDFPSVQVMVTLIQDKHVYSEQVALSVAREQQKLQVSVTPEKDQFAPGETAAYRVQTRDYRGRPVPAEVALSVVDASIYALAPDNAPDIESFFYGAQQVRVSTDFSFAAQYSGGAFQTVAKPKPAAQSPSPAIRVRRFFADTAFWNPFVVTDADGTARVSFALPDNLTTWRATARGITLATAVGSATHDTVSTLPLLVRLELPRFFVQGDRATVSAIVHNETHVARTVVTGIEATGATLLGAGRQTLSLAAGGQQRLDWQARITDRAQARFLITADGGTGAQDATELTLPVLPDGLKMIEARADTLSGNGDTARLDLTSLPPDTSIVLSLSPSLASAVFDSLQSLESYPYGCAEQTVSAFLPDIAVARTLKRLGANRVVHPDLDGWVNLGLQKLYRYQHGDGGWNWWEFDQTDGDMTAYVLSALLQARAAGYLVDDQRVLRGTESLFRQLAGEQELSRRADWLLPLAMTQPQRAADALVNLYARREKLDLYGKASLCLALAQAGGRMRPSAAVIAHELAARAVVHGRTAYWPAQEGGYSWRSDDVQVTAHVLRALLTAGEPSPLKAGAVRWLMANRSGPAWGSTRSSAEAVFAIAQFLELSGELRPDFHARVALDGQSVRDAAFGPGSAFDPPVAVTLGPDVWRGHKTLTVDRQGAGVLYAATTMTYLVPPASAHPMARGITVQRHYQVTAADPSLAGIVGSGEDIQVFVDLTADADYRYALLEDPVPAGCEVVPPDTPSDDGAITPDLGGGGLVRQEIRDDKVAFFFDSLPRGRTRLSYRLHAETPGVYQILPSLASLVYFPEIRGNSGLATAQIGEAGGR